MKYMNNHYGKQKIYGKQGMNLQLFAEEDPEDDDPEDPEEDPEDDPDAEDDPEEDPDSEDKEKGKKERLYTKKEMASIVKKEVAKAIKEKDDRQSEAEKLKNMTKEQREAHDQKKKGEKVEELERKLARMELMDTASDLLKESEIPVSKDVLHFVVGNDAEETAENIQKFVAIKDAIVLAVSKERNTGKTPKVVTGGKKKEIKKEDLVKMSYKEHLAFKQKDPEGYKKLMEE